MSHLARLGGMLASPRATLEQLLREDAPGSLARIFGWLGVLFLGAEPTRAGRAVLVARVEPVDGFWMLVQSFTSRMSLPIAGMLGAAVLLAFVASRLRLELPFDRALDTAGYLLTPYLLLGAVGIIGAAFGLRLWALPHERMFGSAPVVIAKVLGSFGPSLVLLGFAVHGLLSASRAGETEL